MKIKAPDTRTYTHYIHLEALSANDKHKQNCFWMAITALFAVPRFLNGSNTE